MALSRKMFQALQDAKVSNSERMKIRKIRNVSVYFYCYSIMILCKNDPQSRVIDSKSRLDVKCFKLSKIPKISNSVRMKIPDRTNVSVYFYCLRSTNIADVIVTRLGYF